jgi:hypothetical protein
MQKNDLPEVHKARKKILEENYVVTGIPHGHYERIVIDRDLF